MAKKTKKLDLAAGLPAADLVDGAMIRARRERGCSPCPCGRGDLRDQCQMHSLWRTAWRGRDLGRDGSVPLASCLFQPEDGRGAPGAGD